MKIHYHFLMDPRSGGPHQFIKNFIKITKNKIKNKVIINGVKNTIKLSFYRNYGRYLYFFEIIINFIKIILFFLKKNDLNNDVSINIHGFYNFAPLIFAFFSNKKINWFIHEEIKNKFFFVFKLIPKRFNIFFVYDFKSIKLKKKSNFFIIKPSVDTKFWYSKNRSILKDSFLNIGNLNPLKNHILLLNAFLKINKKTKIFIAGGKLQSHKNYYNNILDLKKKIEKNKKTKVSLLGKINKKMIKKNLSLSNFFIMTSRSEGTPFALLEAMSFKKICIIPKINTLNKIFINNFNGFYFKDNDIKSLSAVLIKVLSLSNNKKILIGERARKIILNNFSNEIFKKNITRFFIKKYE